MPLVNGPFPPTPVPSINSKTEGMFDLDQPQAGPSRLGPSPPHSISTLPPTPPVDLASPHAQFDSYTEPRYRTSSKRTGDATAARRPASTYPATGDDHTYHHAHRKYTDPVPYVQQSPTHEPYPPAGQHPQPQPHHQHPHPQHQQHHLSLYSTPGSAASQHQLDVDLDVYAQDYDEEDIRQPTLSFVTTDSTTSSPSIHEPCTYGAERVDQKPEPEPRIRLRTSQGRQSAYSSAESSMASGAYSYHAYSDNSVPPPMPVASIDFSRSNYSRSPAAEDASLASYRPGSPGSSYDQHQLWRSPSCSNRQRSDSVTTADSFNSSASSNGDQLSTSFAHSFSYLSNSFPNRNPWEDEPTQPAEAHAVAMMGDGRGAILDLDKLEAMGGLRVLASMSENDFARLPRYTHLLLPGLGPDILSVLSPLLDVLSSTLVVLDVSHNDILELPSTLRHCAALEELNVSGNPLRQLPPFIGECTNLRMLVADSCALQNLPFEVSHLTSLHTICVRSNRLVVLPSWLCLLDHLETLRIDNNPFAPQWVPIVTPILATSLYQQRSHSRTGSQQSLSVRSVNGIHRTPGSSVPPSPIMSPTGPFATSEVSLVSSYTSTSTGTRPPPPAPPPSTAKTLLTEASASAQSLRPSPRGASTNALVKRADANLVVANRAPSRSNSNPAPAVQAVVQPGATLPASAIPRRAQSSMGHYTDDSDADHDKPGKWGFLRKMSMSRLRSEKERSHQVSAAAAANIKVMPPPLPHTNSMPGLAPGPPRPPMPMPFRSANVLPTISSPAMEGGSDLAPQNSLPTNIASAPPKAFGNTSTLLRNKRRSFLPIDPSPPSLSVQIPSLSPLMSPQATLGDIEHPRYNASDDAMETLGDEVGDDNRSRRAPSESSLSINPNDVRYVRGLETIKSYLRDLFDLSLPPLEPYGGFEVIDSTADSTAGDSTRGSIAGGHLSLGGAPSRGVSIVSSGSERETRFPSESEVGTPTKRYRDDKGKRARVIREIYETEKTYVRGLSELVSIYVRPASMPTSSTKANESVIPLSERKVVFGGVESVLVIHRDNFLPALERVVRPLLETGDDPQGLLSARVAHQVGEVFRTYIAYMKQYSTYINNFDNALSRMKAWTTGLPGTTTTARPTKQAGGIAAAAVGASMVGASVASNSDNVPHSGSHLTPSQKKRVKTFLKRCKEHPKHSQINLESYLLLPVQRVPRYKLLLEDLANCTPPRESIGPNDALDDAIQEIANLASLMNEEKREADSRLRLINWQQRITSRGPSPLVQPHRKLILDGPLTLLRVVKKGSTFVEVDTSAIKPNADGDSTITGSKVVVPVDFIKPESMDKPIMLILCSDMLVLVQKRSSESWESQVDLFSVLRMATLREPASVATTNDRVLRVVDNKSIYYFSSTSHSLALQWCRAINQQNRR